MATFEARGAYTALVTPFTPDGTQIDWAAYEKLLDLQLKGGVSGLVPCGTTGETPTLSDSEQLELVRRTAKFVAGRVPVVAGTGSNSTKKTIETSLAALEAGADGVMIVTPYYNKPSQDGILRHIELVARAVSAPIWLYNIPGRTGVEISVETTLRALDSCPNITAIKDATGSIMYCQGVLQRALGRVAILSGDDPLTLPMLSVGATGVVSVTSNVLPRQVAEVISDYEKGKTASARDRHLALYPVHKVMFLEPNPQPAKAALAARGLMSAAVRPPLVEASAATRAAIESALRAYEAS